VSDAPLLRPDAPLAAPAAVEPLPSRKVDKGLRRPRLLLVSALISMPYRVMRTADAAGADVYVLGAELSRCLAHSRYCRAFVPSERPLDGERDEALAAEINRQIARFGIDLVLPGDVQATRTLIASRDLIEAPLFPLPTLEQFDNLNNKWFFTQLCGELGIPTPPSRVIADAAQLREELTAGSFALPAIVKPINHDGGLGVIRFDRETAVAQSAKVDYGPMIVQDFIPGRDIGASVYCEKGEIKAFIAHELTRATYVPLTDERIQPALARITARMGVDGVFNFDMRLAPDGEIYYLECNPRFFFKINLSMLAGVNFVAAGLSALGHPAQPSPTPGAVRLPKALAAALPTMWRITARDFRMLWYLWSDPVSSLREALGIDWEYPERMAQRRHFIAPKTDKPEDRAIAA
jgi:predicted ATP-grasp superfamily ATP-dependent carboligase